MRLNLMKRMDVKILCLILGMITCTTSIFGQERTLRMGFSASPMISWLANNDNQIVRTGGNFGMKLGTSADIYFKENYSFTTGISLGFHEGGSLRYETGGNFLPKSDLSDEMLKTGDKPLPDGVKITYSLQYVEIPIGLKITSKEMGYLRYFIEAPMFSFAFLTRGRANIETPNEKFEQENIYKDLSVFNVFWGFGAGVEYSISENNALIGGIYFQNGLLDVINDNGHTANDNPDLIPPYLLEREDSRASVSNLILRIGILF